MSDEVNSALAGAETAPVSDPMSVLDAVWEGDPGSDTEELEGSEVDDAEPTEDEATELEGEEVEAEEEAGEDAEEPEDDASEPKPEAEDDDVIHGNKLVVLRDNSKVRVGELKAAYEKVKDYERALPQIQQRIQQVALQEQQIAAQTQQFQPVLAQVAEILQNQIPPRPDVSLRVSDPVEYFLQKDAYDTAVAQLREVNTAKAEHERQNAARQAQALQQQQQQAVHKFVEAHPELKTPEKAQAFIKDFNEAVSFLGFSPQEASQVYDPRLYKAMKYVALGMRAEAEGNKTAVVKTQKVAVAKAKVAAVPPVAKPAARVAPAVKGNAAASNALKLLRETGSKAAADDFLSRFE